jgi:hypothetical protein
MYKDIKTAKIVILRNSGHIHISINNMWYYSRFAQNFEKLTFTYKIYLNLELKVRIKPSHIIHSAVTRYTHKFRNKKRFCYSVKHTTAGHRFPLRSA